MDYKKVLMIAYQFPPMGGAGVQRTAKFAKYLHQFGWDSIVFTADTSGGIIDASLLEDFKNVEVIRTKAYDFEQCRHPFRLMGKVLSRKIFIPDGQWFWYRKNRKKAVEAVIEHQPDVLYTTSYPYSDHLIGAYLKKRFPQLPWIVDFRDEWTQNPYILDMKHSAYRMEVERGLEKEVIASCDYFITNSPHMLNNFKQEHNLEDRSYVIPNGFDKSDFEGLTIDKTHHEKLVITYAGAMYGRRKADPFLQALKNIMDAEKVDPKKIKVNFIGHFSKENIQKVKQYIGSEEVISFVPYLPHKKSIEFLMNSDVLLLIVGSGAGMKNFYTGKIFEYINTCKTILGLVPVDGAAADVIRETQTGYVVDSDDVEAIEAAMVDIYKRWEVGTLAVNTVWEAVKKYDRIELTRQLSEVFNKSISNLKI
ncbi:MAG: glycosyltransferase [Vallitaleaceae bacterium]|nr:glycosyltransferase [Vallitaleaceae bacterium]